MKYVSITDGWGFFQVQFRIFTPLLLLSHVACFSGWQEGGGEELTTCVPIITLTTVLVHLTRSPVLCLLSVSILLHPASTPVPLSSVFSWAALESRAANTALTTWNPPTPSLREICPARRRAETKATLSLLHQTQPANSLSSWRISTRDSSPRAQAV